MPFSAGTGSPRHCGRQVHDPPAPVVVRAAGAQLDGACPQDARGLRLRLPGLRQGAVHRQVGSGDAMILDPVSRYWWQWWCGACGHDWRGWRCKTCGMERH